MISYRQWYPEVNHHCPGCPILLVGTKVDLRENQQAISDLRQKGKQPVPYDQGVAMARELRMARYLECSAATDPRSVKAVFDEGVRLALGRKPPTPKPCRFL